MKAMRNTWRGLGVKPEGKYHSEDLEVDGKLMLK
jgi:hypothetical protein